MSDELIKNAEDFLQKFKKSNNKKEKEDDSTRLVSDWGFSGSSSDPTVSGVLTPLEGVEGSGFLPDLELPAVPTSPPVGIDLGFGFTTSKDKLNLEFDEETNETIQTYKDDRSFFPDVVAFIEKHFFDQGDIPPFKLLHETFRDYPECPRYLKGWKDVIEDLYERQLLTNRGLPTYRTAEDYLEPKFIAACTRILNPHDKRTDAAKLKELGISSAQWNAWLNRKKYFDYYSKRADKIFDEELQTEAKRRLGDLVRNGDLSAIKYLDERTGVYRTNNGNNVEVIGAVIQAMMSILARTVTSDIINIISSELRNEPIIKSLMGEVIESKAS